ncbi:hypothetical protein [Algoriphagus aquimarinus]|uniref:Uncharacterized protein n=1 Tax=Algoriphagus aquimarinus TaxID=237018 RepID=A0A1I1BP26_9BACT|nr:hypothetical protein [Algoriphagus aquimarinus]SFB51406.1 hypothetical protein SAMN04489723_11557 [Algoriphagus aquimarinus]|tara:strand:- start:76525 stop:76995 length:471 start_codon:yes stop_codon:yes gene_type:complete
MESNRTYHFIFKYIFLGAALIVIAVPLLSYIFPNAVELNGETGPTSLITTIAFGVTGVILLVFFFVVKDNFAIVQFGNQSITIKHNGQESVENWLDIDSISQFRFIFPPLYSLKIKGNKRPIWFNTDSNYVSVGGYTMDHSDMGNLITKKKRELGI